MRTRAPAVYGRVSVRRYFYGDDFYMGILDGDNFYMGVILQRRLLYARHFTVTIPFSSIMTG